MKKYIVLLIILCCFACSKKPQNVLSVTVKNTLDKDRAFETVEIDVSTITLDNHGLKVTNAETNEVLISQIVDANSDGSADLLLFQPTINANAEVKFNIELVSPLEVKNDTLNERCFSRFVPERTDDYAWENNRVAFRTYGPVAQKMIEDGIKGGTLSSGIDAWLKRVEYPIINKWYQKHTSGSGSYHKDTGEGVDNFHVGVSRGVGGIAIKTDSTYSFSKNFTEWKTLTTGPIRTSFVLTYADWDAAGNTISEEKKITLDYGQNLSKFEIALKGTETISAGLTLHEKDGEIGVDEDKGWISYWEPHEDSELGTGIVVPDNAMVGYEHYVTDKKDESNLFSHIRVNNNTATYYAGFGWKKSGQFETKTAWENYLNNVALKVNNPLKVILN